MCVLPVTLSLQASRKLLIVAVELIALTSVLASAAVSKPSSKNQSFGRRSGDITGALFFALAVLASAELNAACSAPESDYFEVGSAFAIDGDTIVLNDGRHLRLIGVNTPEMERDRKPNQLLAVAAKRATNKFLKTATYLRIYPGVETSDRYGRLLAHVNNQRGESLEETLVAGGLAYYIAVPPNLALGNCLSAAEGRARSEKLGLWSVKSAAAVELKGLSGLSAGFQLLRGRVLKVVKSKTAHWLLMEAGVTLRLGDADRVYFQQLRIASLVGKTIEVRGWLVPAKGRRRYTDTRKWLMHLRHPTMFSEL